MEAYPRRREISNNDMQEVIEEIFPEDMILNSGRLDGSMGQLIAEGIQD